MVTRVCRQRMTTTTTIDVYPHSVLNDVVCVGSIKKRTKSLSSCRVPPANCAPTSDMTSLFQSWPSRAEHGWPMTHRVLVCDRFCGEAVLRGSDIFVRGVMCADSGIKENEKVAVCRSSVHLSKCAKLVTSHTSASSMTTGVYRYSRGGSKNNWHEA